MASLVSNGNKIKKIAIAGQVLQTKDFLPTYQFPIPKPFPSETDWLIRHQPLSWTLSASSTSAYGQSVGLIYEDANYTIYGNHGRTTFIYVKARNNFVFVGGSSAHTHSLHKYKDYIVVITAKSVQRISPDGTHVLGNHTTQPLQRYTYCRGLRMEPYQKILVGSGINGLITLYDVVTNTYSTIQSEAVTGSIRFVGQAGKLIFAMRTSASMVKSMVNIETGVESDYADIHGASPIWLGGDLYAVQNTTSATSVTGGSSYSTFTVDSEGNVSALTLLSGGVTSNSSIEYILYAHGGIIFGSNYAGYTYDYVSPPTVIKPSGTATISDAVLVKLGEEICLSIIGTAELSAGSKIHTINNDLTLTEKVLTKLIKNEKGEIVEIPEYPLGVKGNPNAVTVAGAFGTYTVSPIAGLSYQPVYNTKTDSIVLITMTNPLINKFWFNMPGIGCLVQVLDSPIGYFVKMKPDVDLSTLPKTTDTEISLTEVSTIS